MAIPYHRARPGLVPAIHTADAPVNVNIKTGKSYSVVVFVTGRTVVIKDETGEIPCGRMFSVQKWVRAPWATPTGVFNGGLQVPASFLELSFWTHS